MAAAVRYTAQPRQAARVGGSNPLAPTNRIRDLGSSSDGPFSRLRQLAPIAAERLLHDFPAVNRQRDITLRIGDNERHQDDAHHHDCDLEFAVGRSPQARCRIGGEDVHNLRLLFKFILKLYSGNSL